MLMIETKKREIFKDLPDGSVSVIKVPSAIIQLEHSLISLRKWESIWHKPFLTKGDKTNEEIKSYIRCMTMNSVNPDVYDYLTTEDVKKVVDYIEDPYTATTFRENKLIGAQKKRGEIVTAEIIYYWMITLNIPPEYQKWHLSQLLTLIKVVSIKNTPKKKRNSFELAKEMDMLNKQRREMYNTTG